MKAMLAIMIIVLLLVGVAAFSLPAIGAPLAPDRPLPLCTATNGGDAVPHIACEGAPCDCPYC